MQDTLDQQRAFPTVAQTLQVLSGKSGCDQGFLYVGI